MKVFRILLALSLALANVPVWACEEGKASPDAGGDPPVERMAHHAHATTEASQHDHSTTDVTSHELPGGGANSEHGCCTAHDVSSSCAVSQGCGHTGGASVIATPPGFIPAVSPANQDLGRFTAALSLRHSQPPFRPPSF